MSNLKVKSPISFILKEIYKKNYLLLIALFIIRSIYILFNNYRTGDIFFYESIANGLLNGCGIGLILDDGSCSPLVGHYFPGFFYLIAISFKIGIGIKGLVFLISQFQLLSIFYLSFIIKKYKNDKNLSNIVLIILSLSPLTMGWSRLILIEPVLTGFSILFLSVFVQIFHEGFSKRNFVCLILIQILALYIKPTAILFSVPFVILLLNKLKIIEIIKKLFLWIIIISIAISPWGFRNIYEGAEMPFNSALNSNFFPNNTTGYINWLSTWVITEHEQAHNGFPVARSTWVITDPEKAKNGFPVVRVPFDLKIKKAVFNPFISSQEIQSAQKLVSEKTHFSKEDNIYFENAAVKRRKKLGVFGLIGLHFLKIISLILNPLNSWGWPLELSSILDNLQSFQSTSKFITVISNPQILIRTFLKLSLFVYRIFFFYLFYRIFNSKFSLKPRFSFKKFGLNYLLAISSISFLLATLFLISVVFPSLEHRFIAVVIPWIELSILLDLSKRKKTRLYNAK